MQDIVDGLAVVVFTHETDERLLGSVVGLVEANAYRSQALIGLDDFFLCLPAGGAFVLHIGDDAAYTLREFTNEIG